jgi:hypothetical protein
MSRVFPNHKKGIYDNSYKGSEFPQWEEITEGAGQPSTGHYRNKQEREMKMRRLVIAECGFRM